MEQANVNININLAILGRGGMDFSDERVLDDASSYCFSPVAGRRTTIDEVETGAVDAYQREIDAHRGLPGGGEA